MCFTWTLASGQSPIYVSLTASGANDGSSWEDAYTSLVDGLANASFGDDVWISAGTYTPWGASDLSFELPSGVKLYGGFEGTESSLAERDWEANPTTLSGDIDGQNYSKIVLLITDPDTSTLIDGLTIKNAQDNDPLPCSNMFPCHSGGMEVLFYSNNGNPGLTIRNCIIKENIANQGAGMSVFGEGVLYSLVLENVLVENNSSFNEGGGAYISGGGKDILVSRTSFENNFGKIGGGGFVYFDDGETNTSLTLKNCNFNFNSLELGGGAGIGALKNNGELNLLIDSCVFIENSAGEPWNNETWGLGGAIILQASGNTHSISNSFFLRNFCDVSGGAIVLNSHDYLIYNCIFIENEAGIRGGAIYSNAGEDWETKITNCSFIDNQAEYGTAISSWLNNVLLIHNSVFQDQITDNPRFFNSYNANISANNCYFSAPNSDSLVIEEIGSAGNFNFGSNNLFDVDPQFFDEANGDYSLDYCSPLIDAGDRTIVEQLGIETDIAGVDRIINGAPDIGAYENDDVLVNLYSQDLSCSGEMDGLAQVDPVGGQFPWTVEWSTGSNDLIIDELESGSYWVSLTDANSCSRYWEFEIGEATPIEAQFEVTDAWSSNSMDGAIDLEQISGGNPPYAYNWNTGDTTSSIHDLSPGEYSLTITDTSDCDTTLVFIVDVINGVRDIKNEGIRLFPNPGQDRLWIEMLPPGTRWQLFDAVGRMQIQGEANERRFSIQIAELPKGIYLFRFYNPTWSSSYYANWVKM